MEHRALDQLFYSAGPTKREWPSQSLIASSASDFILDKVIYCLGMEILCTWNPMSCCRGRPDLFSGCDMKLDTNGVTRSRSPRWHDRGRTKRWAGRSRQVLPVDFVYVVACNWPW